MAQSRDSRSLRIAAFACTRDNVRWFGSTPARAEIESDQVLRPRGDTSGAHARLRSCVANFSIPAALAACLMISQRIFGGHAVAPDPTAAARLRVRSWQAAGKLRLGCR